MATVGSRLAVIRSMASWNVSDSATRAISLMAAKTSGGPEASRRAVSQARARTASSSGEHLVDHAPPRPASAALIQRPVSSSSMATW